jgi:hypothetical protein
LARVGSFKASGLKAEGSLLMAIILSRKLPSLLKEFMVLGGGRGGKGGERGCCVDKHTRVRGLCAITGGVGAFFFFTSLFLCIITSYAPLVHTTPIS